MSKELRKDYDWRTRVHYEKLFAEQCAIAVREHLERSGVYFDDDEDEKDKKIAERIGIFFSDALNALYIGFTQYPDALSDSLLPPQKCSNKDASLSD